MELLIKPNIWDLAPGILLSIFLSLVCGMILGIEREISNKWAGIRTHMLVCLGSCIFTILSIYGFPIFVDPTNIHSSRFGDPTRIAAQILTGIGFIGGGTVLRHGTSVFGLTTAATLWVAAAIGMVCACKMYWLAVVLTPVVVGVLVLIRVFEKRYLHFLRSKDLELRICINKNDADFVCKELCHHMKPESLKQNTPDINSDKVEVCAKIRVKAENPIDYLYTKLADFDGVQTISIREINEKD